MNEETQHELTIKMTAGSIASANRALEAINRHLDLSLEKGLIVTVKVVTEDDVTENVAAIEREFRSRRGIIADVTHKVTTKHVEGDDKAPSWNQTAFDVSRN